MRLSTQNSSYPMKLEFNNCFIIYSKYFQALKGENLLFVFLVTKNNATSSLDFLDRRRFNNLKRAALLTLSVQYDKCFLNLVNSSWL